MSGSKPRILVADDEPRYIQIIQLNLEIRGYDVLVARNGEAAVEIAAAEAPDLIILDIRMPGLNGYEACQHIRQFSDRPILMLTALAEEADKVKGLDLGADDYITKPFGIEELLARVRAALRRSRSPQEPEPGSIFQAGAVRVDFAGQAVFVNEREALLTSTEYRLLLKLIQQAGQVILYDTLLDSVWGPGYEGENRILRQAIYRLRQKIERDPRDPEYIQTRSGLGYIFVAPDQEQDL